MERQRWGLLLTIAALAIAGGLGVHGGAEKTFALPGSGAPGTPASARPPLASFMGDMQRYAQKLGYALAEKNAPLAGFYVDKIRQTARYIRVAYPSYDGLPVGSLVAMIDAPIRQVRTALDKERWEQARERYESAIGVCNACHAAAQRPFVVIRPASGPSPYNQDFTVQR